MDNKIKAFMEQYNRVFDTDGNVKPCGREECKNLINMCKIELPGEDFGNPMTGMMNVENIQKFRKKILLKCALIDMKSIIEFTLKEI